jgi:DNA-directed RNA polymerase subunit E'
MYTSVKIQDTVRIPPQLFGEDLEKVVEETVQKAFEGTIKKNHGVIVVVENVKAMGNGIVIHGDGGMYQRVEFEALTFNPKLQEVTDAVICEVVEFGAFCHIGPLDALIHMSQIMNDYVEVDAESERIVGKENKKVLKVGDPVRARIVAVSLNELTARESKIGLTMRQPALGVHEWIHEPKITEKEAKKKAEKEAKKKEKKEKKKKGKK